MHIHISPDEPYNPEALESQKLLIQELLLITLLLGMHIKRSDLRNLRSDTQTQRSLPDFATWRTNNCNHSEQFHISLTGAKCSRLGSDDVLMRLRSFTDGNQFDLQCVVAPTASNVIQSNKSRYYTFRMMWHGYGVIDDCEWSS